MEKELFLCGMPTRNTPYREISVVSVSPAPDDLSKNDFELPKFTNRLMNSAAQLPGFTSLNHTQSAADQDQLPQPPNILNRKLSSSTPQMDEENPYQCCCNKILKLEEFIDTRFKQLENKMIQHQKQMLDALDKSDQYQHHLGLGLQRQMMELSSLFLKMQTFEVQKADTAIKCLKSNMCFGNKRIIMDY
jgi:hypothetical protein